MPRRSLSVTVASAAVLLAIVAAVGCGRSTRVSVSTATATMGPITREVVAAGTLQPARMVEVGSQVSGTLASLSADFNSSVRAGQVIARLDPATYRSQLASANAALVQAEAERSQAATALADADTKYRRARELAAADLVTQADLDTARLTADQARADVKARDALVRAAAANVKKAQVDLEHTVIRSPIDGIVVNRNVDAGQTVTATLQSPVLFTIADLAKMDLLTQVSEGEVGAVAPGSTVTFRVESLGSTTFQGTVASVRLQPYVEAATPVGTSGAPAATATGASGAPAATATGTTGTTGASSSTPGSSPAGTQAPAAATPASSAATTASSGRPAPASPGSAGGPMTYTAVVTVDNADGRLAPGATAIVTIAGDTRREVVRVPNAALAFRPSAALLERTGQKTLTATLAGGESAADPARQVRYVWRFENQRFSPVEVRLGLSDTQWTEVVGGGIEPGDRLVTAAAPR